MRDREETRVCLFLTGPCCGHITLVVAALSAETSLPPRQPCWTGPKMATMAKPSCQTHLWAAPHSDQRWGTDQNQLTRPQWLYCQRDWSVSPSPGQSQILARIPGMSQALVLQLQGIYLRAPLTGSVSSSLFTAPPKTGVCVETHGIWH